MLTLGILAAVAAVTWALASPNGDQRASDLASGVERPGAKAMARPTLAGAIPTPPITPGVGQGGRAAATDYPTSTLIAASTVELYATETAAPLATEPPTATATEPPSPTPMPIIDLPPQLSVNGIPYDTIVVLPESVIQHARQIYAAGQALGRNSHAYSKVGDSTIDKPHFLTRYDTGPYNLGGYASLQPAIDYFLGSHGRDSAAVHVGLHSWTANDPAWADKSVCLPNESPVECEIRLHNPSILVLRLGTNDVGVPEMFDSNIRQIVDTAISAGVIPIIGTKADRHEGSDENNEILRKIAADYQIPLWNFDRVADTLPGRGLDEDNSHMMTFYSHDFSDPTAFTRGHAMHNLTALMILDAIWREVMLGGS